MTGQEPTPAELREMYIGLLMDSLTASLYDESAWAVADVTRRSEERSLRRPLTYLKGLVRHWVVRPLRKRSILVVERRPFDAAARAEGMDWPCFGYTMAGRRRLENVRFCVEDVLRAGVPGDFLEAGVWRGGMAIFLRALLKLHGVTDRLIWAADSFEGLPKPAFAHDGHDLSDVDKLKVSLDQVRANFARFGLLDDQVKFLKGWFCDTLPSAPVERLAVLRLDGDLYTSTMDTLRAMYHRVSPGGYVIVDDYYVWESCRQAVTEFLREKNLHPEIRRVDPCCAFWRVESE